MGCEPQFPQVPVLGLFATPARPTSHPSFVVIRAGQQLGSQPTADMFESATSRWIRLGAADSAARILIAQFKEAGFTAMRGEPDYREDSTDIYIDLGNVSP
jgi:hypothetical protein